MPSRAMQCPTHQHFSSHSLPACRSLWLRTSSAPARGGAPKNGRCDALICSIWCTFAPGGGDSDNLCSQAISISYSRATTLFWVESMQTTGANNSRQNCGPVHIVPLLACTLPKFLGLFRFSYRSPSSKFKCYFNSSQILPSFWPFATSYRCYPCSRKLLASHSAYYVRTKNRTFCVRGSRSSIWHIAFSFYHFCISMAFEFYILDVILRSIPPLSSSVSPFHMTLSQHRSPFLSSYWSHSKFPNLAKFCYVISS